MVTRIVRVILGLITAAMTLWPAYPLFYSNGETGWEDKMILYVPRTTFCVHIILRENIQAETTEEKR